MILLDIEIGPRRTCDIEKHLIPEIELVKYHKNMQCTIECLHINLMRRALASNRFISWFWFFVINSSMTSELGCEVLDFTNRTEQFLVPTPR